MGKRTIDERKAPDERLQEIIRRILLIPEARWGPTTYAPWDDSSGWDEAYTAESEKGAKVLIARFYDDWNDERTANWSGTRVDEYVHLIVNGSTEGEFSLYDYDPPSGNAEYRLSGCQEVKDLFFKVRSFVNGSSRGDALDTL